MPTTSYFNSNNGVKTAMYNMIIKVLDKVVQSDLCPTSSNAGMQSIKLTWDMSNTFSSHYHPPPEIFSNLGDRSQAGGRSSGRTQRRSDRRSTKNHSQPESLLKCAAARSTKLQRYPPTLSCTKLFAPVVTGRARPTAITPRQRRCREATQHLTLRLTTLLGA